MKRAGIIEHSMPTIGLAEEKAVINVIRSKYLAEGDVVAKFENELSRYIGCFGGVATGTGTQALHLALLSLGVSRGDEVVIPSYVCRAVLNAVLYTGAKPILCDVNSKDYNMSFSEVKNKISHRTKAIIVTHMYGCPAEVDKFKEYGIPIIEDCAHSVGAEYEGRRVGGLGDLSIFSFEGTKYLVAGEGGMVLARNKYLFNKLQGLKEPDSLNNTVKYTYRMTNLQAAIARVQLSRIGEFIKRRIEIAKMYENSFARYAFESPGKYQGKSHIFHRYMIKIKGNIHSFMKESYKKGIKVKQPVKPLPLYRYLKLSPKGFPNTEYIMKSAVSIPIYPTLTDRQIGYIIKIMKELLLRA